jgi:hypothetical protein
MTLTLVSKFHRICRVSVAPPEPRNEETMNKTLRVTVLGILVTLFASAAHAGGVTVALLPPSGDNVAPAILQASGELLKDHLLRTGAYNIVEPPPSAQPTTAVEPTPAQAAATATALGASQAIVVRVTHIGSTARVRLTVYAAPSGQVVYWDSLAVSGGPDELDAVFQRLAHAMQTGRPVRDSGEIDTVTDKEMQSLGRRQANKVFGLHLMTFLPFNTAGGSFRALPGGGLFWLYDARSWMTDISLDIGGGGGRSLFSAAIGGYYPLLREDFTPYFGGVVRWAYMDFGGSGGSGLSFQPTAGILLGRLSSVQLRADIGYFINSFGEYSTTTTTTVVGGQATTTTGGQHYSHGIVLTVGIGF